MNNVVDLLALRNLYKNIIEEIALELGQDVNELVEKVRARETERSKVRAVIPSPRESLGEYIALKFPRDDVVRAAATVFDRRNAEGERIISGGRGADE